MKFLTRLWDRFPIRFSYIGVSIRYKYDTVTYPWIIPFTTFWYFRSQVLRNEVYFSHSTYKVELLEFLQKPQSFESKLEGFSTQDIIRVLIKDQYSSGYYVTLHDINPMKKSSDFWRALPEKKAVVLLKEVVVLHCKEDSEVHHLCSSIDEGFASVLGWYNGLLIDGNYEDEESS